MKLLVSGAAALAGLLFTFNVQATPYGHYKVVTDTYIMVKPAQISAFDAGIKNWDKCLGQYHFSHAVHAYHSASGNLLRYEFVTDPMSWAEQDAMKFPPACNSLFMSEVLPHEAGADRIFLVLMPGLSHPIFSQQPKNQPFGKHLMRALSYKLEKGPAASAAFTQAMEAVYAAPAKAHVAPWHHSATYAVLGGGHDNNPDYLLVGTWENWAVFGAGPNQPIMKLLQMAYGTTKAHDIMHSLNAAVEHVSAQFYLYDASLSYTPKRH